MPLTHNFFQTWQVLLHQLGPLELMKYVALNQEKILFPFSHLQKAYPSLRAFRAKLICCKAGPEWFSLLIVWKSYINRGFWLLWAVTTVRMKNFLSVAPSVVINLRSMWESQESLSRMVILGFTLVYAFHFRFCPNSGICLLQLCYFPLCTSILFF